MTTATTTLADFLLARIAEDEEVARAAAGSGFDLGSRLVPDELDGHVSGLHIDPARVLAECAAKRRIVEQYVWEVENYPADDEEYSRSISSLEFAVTALASVYADAPGFREEWR